jgi:hypothetical protein
MSVNNDTNTIVIANIGDKIKDFELVKKIRYNLEKAGYSVTEEYSGDVLTIVWTKPKK